MTATYRREDLNNGAARFEVRKASPPSKVFPIISAVFVGGLAMYIVRPFFPGLMYIAGPFMAWYAFTRVTLYEKAKSEQVPGEIAVVVTAAREGLGIASAYKVPRNEITGLLWRDWSGDGTESSAAHALYVETKDASQIIWNGFDRQTVTRLANEIAAALGGVPVTGGSPESQAPQNVQQQELMARVEKMRQEFAKTTITADMQPMVAGDLVLQEIEPGRYELQEVTASGRALYRAVPDTDDVSQIIRCGEANADGRNVWFSKLVDKGPAVLMTKATGRSHTG